MKKKKIEKKKRKYEVKWENIKFDRLIVNQVFFLEFFEGYSFLNDVTQ